MLLMNQDQEVLQFWLDDSYIRVTNSDFLPYSLKGFLESTDCSSVQAAKKSAAFISAFKDWLCARALSPMRDNAKAILGSVNLPQDPGTASALEAVFLCNGLSMVDNFWLKEEDCGAVFCDVNLRRICLGDAAYEIAILGKNAQAANAIIAPELTVGGMFTKTWVRKEEGSFLCKTDRTRSSVNAVAEWRCSQILDHSNVDHVPYTLEERDGKKFAVCKCIATDEFSIINGYDLWDWCTHNGIEWIDFLEANCLGDFSRMCVVDYVLANTDRHLGNMHFFVRNSDNCFMGMTPLLDHNQALLADGFGTKVEELVYPATGLTMYATAHKYYESSKLEIDKSVLPKRCLERLQRVKGCVT